MVNFKMPRGPNSLMGTASRPVESDGTYVSKRVRNAEAGAVSLRVMGNDNDDSVALLHPECTLLTHADTNGVVLLQLEAGSDCVLRAIGCSEETLDQCPIGCLALTETQRINIHVAEDQTASFKVFDIVPEDGTANTLHDIELEVRLLRIGQSDDASSSDESSDDEETENLPSENKNKRTQVDGAVLTKEMTARLLNRWVCAGELFSVEADQRANSQVKNNNTTVRVRVVSLNTADPKSTDVLQPGYHAFRGVVTQKTKVYLHAEGDVGVGQSVGRNSTTCSTSTSLNTHTTVCGALTVTNSTSRDDHEARQINEATETVEVTTSDGEVFPVHRKLLRPCLALTKFVREAAPDGIVSSGKREAWERENRLAIDDESTSKQSETKNSNKNENLGVQIEIDCETFDNILIWLECDCMGKQVPEYDVRTTESLIEASEKLGLLTLADQCRASVGQHSRRIRLHKWSDVITHNQSGGVRIAIDGMVLDVKRWLPEHPGGDRIIPSQSTNVDATRHFELYHASKESFLYLKTFYVGEVVEKDLQKIPRVVNSTTGVEDPPASPESLSQLREYTKEFRIDPQGEYKAEEEKEEVVRVHLGAR